jgi:hypothetical protein
MVRPRGEGGGRLLVSVMVTGPRGWRAGLANLVPFGDEVTLVCSRSLGRARPVMAEASG